MRATTRATVLSLAMAAWCWSGPVLFAANAERDGTAGHSRAWMGVFLRDAVDGGIDLVAVVPGGPADRGGLRVGDVVVQVEEIALPRVDDLTRILDAAEPGGNVELSVIRAGATLRRVIELDRRVPSSRVVSGLALATAPPAPAAPPPPLVGSRAYGLVLADVTPDLRAHYGAPANVGVLVTGIDPQRRAAGDGFRVGDIVVRLGDRPVRGVDDVERVLVESDREAIEAALIRGRRAAELTLRPLSVGEAEVAHDLPSGERVAAYTAAVASAAVDQRSRAREVHARALRMEIERLQKRIEQLKLELDSLEREP